MILHDFGLCVTPRVMIRFADRFFMFFFLVISALCQVFVISF